MAKSISISQLKTAVAEAVQLARKQYPTVKLPNEGELPIYHWPHVFCGIPVPWPIDLEAREQFAFASTVAKSLAGNPSLAGLGEAGGKTEPVIIIQGGKGFVGFTAGGEGLAQ